MPFAINELFDDEQTRRIFDQVVDQRKVQFKNLRRVQGLDRKVAREKLGLLKEAHLVEERGAPIEDFSIFYVTAEGLEAKRKLRQIENLRSAVP